MVGKSNGKSAIPVGGLDQQTTIKHSDYSEIGSKISQFVNDSNADPPTMGVGVQFHMCNRTR